MSFSSPEEAVYSNPIAPYNELGMIAAFGSVFTISVDVLPDSFRTGFSWLDRHFVFLLILFLGLMMRAITFRVAVAKDSLPIRYGVWPIVRTTKRSVRRLLHLQVDAYRNKSVAYIASIVWEDLEGARRVTKLSESSLFDTNDPLEVTKRLSDRYHLRVVPTGRFSKNANERGKQHLSP